MRIKLIGVVFFSFLFAGPTLADSHCSWPCFTPSESSKKKPKDRKEQLSKLAENLRIFNQIKYLDVSDSSVVSSDLRALVGTYGFFEKTGDTRKLHSIGSTFAPKLAKVQIKDRTIFKGVVSKGFNSGVKIPILSISLSDKQIAEINVETISFASVEPNANLVACNFPISAREDAKNGKKEYFFVAAATVTKVTKRVFSEGKAEAKGIFSILSINGNTYVSDETIVSDYIVAPQTIVAKPASLEECIRAGIIKLPKGSKDKSIDGRGLAASVQAMQERTKVALPIDLKVDVQTDPSGASILNPSELKALVDNQKSLGQGGGQLEYVGSENVRQ